MVTIYYTSDYASSFRGLGDPSSISTGIKGSRFFMDDEEEKKHHIDRKRHEPENRTNLTRVFDLLQTGQYASLGAIRTQVNDDSLLGTLVPQVNFIKGAISGAGAGLFGDNETLGTKRHYTSELLDDMGWRPESTGGKIARGAVGFVGDVFLDPLTYVSGGTSALFRGKGRAGAMATHGMASEMTQEGAEQIVRRQMAKEGRRYSPQQISDDAVKLTREINEQAGLSPNVRDMTFSLANAPFGKKIFGRHADKSYTIAGADAIQDVGERTIAPGYARVRDYIYGSRIGELFSTNTPLYRLSKNDPEGLMNFLRHNEYVTGNAKNKREAEEAIRKTAEEFDFTEAESKQILDLMEDKTVFHKVRSAVGFHKSQDAKRYRANIHKSKKRNEMAIDELQRKKKRIEELESSLGTGRKDYHSEIERLKREYDKGVRDLNIRHVKDKKKHEQALKMYQERLEDLNRQQYPQTPEKLLKDFDDYKRHLDESRKKSKLARDTDIKTETRQAYDEVRDELDTTPGRADDAVEFPDQDKLVKDISRFIFGEGRDDVISPNVDIRHLDELMQKVRKGESRSSLAGYVEQHEDIFTGRAKRIWQTIAAELNYKNWNEKFTKPHEKLMKKAHDVGVETGLTKDQRDGYFKLVELKNKYGRDNLNYVNRNNLESLESLIMDAGIKGLDVNDLENLNYLENLYKKREVLKDHLFRSGSDAELDKRIGALHELRLDKEIKELGDAIYHRYDYFTDEDILRRRRMIEEDSIQPQRRQKYRIKRDEYGNPVYNSKGGYIKEPVGEVRGTDEVIGFETEPPRSDYRSTEFDEKPRRFLSRDDNHKVYNEILEELDYFSDAGRKSGDAVERANQILREVEPILHDSFGKRYSQLTTKQKDALPKMAIKNFKRRSEGKNLLYGVDASKRVRAKSSADMTPKEKALKFAEELEDIHAMRIKPGTDVNIRINDKETARATVRKLRVTDDNKKFIDAVITGEGRVVSDVPVRRVSKVFDKDVELQKMLTDLHNTSGKQFNPNSPKQIGELLYEDLGLPVRKTSKGNYATDAKTLQELADQSEVAGKILEYRKAYRDRITQNIDELAKNSEVTDNFIRKQEDILNKIRIEEEKLAGLDGARKAKEEELRRTFETQSNRAKENLKKLEENTIRMRKSFDEVDVPEIERLTEEVSQMQEAIENDDALETFLRRWDEVSDAELDDVLAKYNVAEYNLRSDIDVSDKVRNTVNFLRNEMIRMGKKEVDIGKLDHEAFQTLIDAYMPRIPTREGTRFFSNKKDELVKKIPGFGDDFGYGRTFSPHMLSRKVKGVTDVNGNPINNPSTRQINEFFAREYPELKGKNVFSENVAEIYLQRALKNNELMYDNYYIQHMFDMFGSDYEGVVEDGFKAVMNYGHLRESAKSMAGIQTDLAIGDAVSLHLREHNIVTNINKNLTNKLKAQIGNRAPTMAEKRWLKETADSQIQSEIDRFLNANYPPEVRKRMFEDAVKDLAGDRLDDMAMPMVSTDRTHMTKITERYDSLIKRYEEHIRGKLKGFENSRRIEQYNTPIDEIRSKQIDNMSIDDVNELVESYLANADRVDAKTLGRIKKKFIKYNNSHRPKAYQINDAIVQKANQARKAQILKDQNNFLKIWDKMTHFIKLNQTSVVPAFHGRNKMGNTFNSALGIGVDAVNPHLQKKTLLASLRKGDIEGGITIKNADGTTSSMTWKEVYNSALDHKAIGQSFHEVEFGSTMSEGLLKRWIPGEFDPTDLKNFKPYEWGTEAGRIVETQDRLLHFASQLSRGLSPEDAAKSSNKFLFDYGDLTAFEQNVMKRIIPYYTWMRKNAPLQLEAMMEHPGRYALVPKIMGGIENMVDEEDRMDDTFVSEYAQDWVQTPFSITEGGSEKPLIWNPNMPFMDFSRMPDPTDAGRSFRAVLPQLNPLITVPTEQTLNKNFFFDSEIVRDGQSQVGRRTHHAMSSFAPYNVGHGMANREGWDRVLHTINSILGVKGLSYDYDMRKNITIQEEKDRHEEKMRKLLSK